MQNYTLSVYSNMAKILLIDDEPDLLAAMAEILRRASHEVTPVSDGRLVLQEFNESEFDLVVTDIIMPGVEGLEILKHLREQNPEFKAIAISGGGRIEPSFHLRLARQLGARETLQKPFKLQTLVEAVERTLEDCDAPGDETLAEIQDHSEIHEKDQISNGFARPLITPL